MRTRMLINQRGMSLVTVLFAMGISTVVMASIIAMGQQKRKMSQQMNVTVSANIIKQKLVGMIIAPQSWQATQTRNSQAFANFNGSTRPLLDIYAANSTTVFYQSTNPQAGFDFNGKTCHTFSTQGNDTCPFRYAVTLKNRVFQNGNWIDTLNFELVFKPSSQLVLNTSSPEYTFDLVRNFNDNSVESACVAVKGVYNASLNTCTERLTPTVTGCPSNQTFRGPAKNGSSTHCDTRTVAQTTCSSGKLIKGFDSRGNPICGDPL